MSTSISIKQTPEGFVPQLVIQRPNMIGVFPVGTPCKTWKKAWEAAQLSRSASKTTTVTETPQDTSNASEVR
jgi:hypothetical protein